MAINTAGDLVSFALRTAAINGVGQTPSADDANDGLTYLAALVANWQARRWLSWALVDTAKVSTGAQTYTVAPAGDFAIARPDRLESAYVRILTGGVDVPLALIESREDYSRIGVKGLVGMPLGVFYEAAFPTGALHFYPVPAGGIYELHVATRTALPVYTSLAQPLNLPPAYLDALIWSLAVRFQMGWGQQPAPAHVAAMRQALATLRGANIGVPELSARGPGGRGSGGVAASASSAFQSGAW